MKHPLSTALDEGPMKRFQWLAVVVCILLNMLDGFDVLVMAFTADAVSQEFTLSGTMLGLLLSAGLVGMAGGSLFVAPWADRIGRRPLIMLCLAVASAGMLLSAASQSPVQLAVLRVLTGLGIGGILACSNVLASEYASKRWRALAVSLNSTGYALGATLGGMFAIVLLSSFGWRSVFLFGGLATAVAIALVFFWLPESLDFLLTKQPQRALQRVNVLARKLGQATLDRLPDPPSAKSAGPGGKVGALFAPHLRRSTVLLWVAFFCVMFGFYFVTSWTPKLLVEAGLSAKQGITGGMLLNLGGIFGAAAIGALAARFRLRNVLINYLVVTAVLLVGFISSTSMLAVAFVLGALVGLLVNGCVAGLYATAPALYDTSIRTTGVGFAIGVGRGGAILSPTIAGVLLDANWAPEHLYIAVSVVFLATAAALLLLRTDGVHGTAPQDPATPPMEESPAR
ncbi:benzoate transport [Halopolyspora algeriensis]|uniref:Benzoate transport n=1 Tax=Halopolyspora algeriensis TaxID=1500506 RepID=A0A368VTG1_9ACTN|nr:MFS transporter [Halopolyspora algeriensis]RCW44486.1 benzoate transport [Halopolyspora algeriensis]TQM55847.1 benzoate transport [Halopolyspora algeriensis]